MTEPRAKRGAGLQLLMESSPLVENASQILDGRPGGPGGVVHLLTLVPVVQNLLGTFLRGVDRQAAETLYGLRRTVGQYHVVLGAASIRVVESCVLILAREVCSLRFSSAFRVLPLPRSPQSSPWSRWV